MPQKKKVTIILEDWRMSAKVTKHGSPDHFKVLKVTNDLAPVAGDYITEQEAKDLMARRETTVTVQEIR